MEIMPSLWPAVDGPSFLIEKVQVKRQGNWGMTKSLRLFKNWVEIDLKLTKIHLDMIVIL